MKHTITLLFLLLGFTALAQVDAIPPGYEKAIRQADREQRRDDNDIIRLDPIIPMAPSEYSATAGGNYTNVLLQVDENAATIQDRAARKIVYFIFDTAGEWTHPGLERFQWKNYNRTFTGEPPADGNGHSTHVAGCIAATDKNYALGPARHLVEIGMAKGIAVKVMDNTGSGQIPIIVGGIQYGNSIVPALIAQGWFPIYVMSFGARGVNAQLDAVIAQAEQLGVMVIAAAGNGGSDGVNTPANGPSAHAIAALNPDGTRATYSDYGAKVYAAAPGTRILSTWPDGSLKEATGTSMATPGFAAVAGITASIHHTATNRQISRFMAKNMTDISPTGWDIYTGFGMPVVTRLLQGNAAAEPNEGNGNPGTGTPPPVTPPTKEKRNVSFAMPMEYAVLWRPFNATSTRWDTAFVSYTIEANTDLYAPDAYDAAARATKAFFTNRGFLLRNTDDFLDAGHWSRHFYEMMVKDYKVTDLKVRDTKGRIGNVPRPGALALRQRIKSIEIKTLTGNWIQ